MAAHPAKRAGRGKRGSTRAPPDDGFRAAKVDLSRERQRLL
jgi:hypothetical protein